MAIERKVVYRVGVEGAVRAANEIGQLDTAAASAAGSMRRSGKAASGAALEYTIARAKVESLGAQFDKVNDKAAKFGGRFGDVRARLGDFEDAVAIFSGVALVQAGQAIVEMGATLYGWTERGKAAKREAEALTGALDEMKGSLDRLTTTGHIEALDPDSYARLGAALRSAKEEQIEYEAALDKMVEAQTRVNEAQAEYDKSIEGMAPSMQGFHRSTSTAGKALSTFEIQLSKARLEAGELREALTKKREVAEAVRREVEANVSASKTMSTALNFETDHILDNITMWGAYQFAVARGHTASTEMADNFVTGHARIANAAIDTAEAIGKAVDKHNAAASAAGRHAESLAKLRAEQARQFASDEADALTQLDDENINTAERYAEQIASQRTGALALAEANAQVAEVEARLLDLQGRAEDAARIRLAATQALELAQAAVRGETEKYITTLRQVHAEQARPSDAPDVAARLAAAHELAAATEAAMAGPFDAIEVAFDHFVNGATVDLEKLAEASEARYGSWETWEGTALSAIDSVMSGLNSISMMFSAIADSEVVPLRNAETRANELLAIAEAAERAAAAESERARDTASAAAADGKLAAASRDRADAEQAVYEARLAVIEAEERSAEVMKNLRALEFALEGAKMVAKTLEAGATAALLYSGGLFPQAAAATAAAVTYGLAAAAYGVAAAYTATTPTARQQRPNAPEDRATAARTVAAGDRERGRDDRPNVYVEFSGGALHTLTEVQDTVVKAGNLAHKRRGGARDDYRRASRRGAR